MWIMKQNGYHAVNISRFDSVGLKKAADGITVVAARDGGLNEKVIVELGMYGSIERAAEVLRGIYSRIEAGALAYDMPPEHGEVHD